jgi:hypothetical protein
MAWTKHFQMVNTDARLKAELKRYRDLDHRADMQSGGTGSNQSSYLPEVYAGHPLRIERYNQYDQMDQDSTVNAALDTIANFATQKDKGTKDLFAIYYNREASDSEMEVLKICLHQWGKINEFKRRLWRMFRSTLKYGDQFFIRDPRNLKWYWVDPGKVEKVLVNEADGKEPEAYIIRELDLNLMSLTATAPSKFGQNTSGTAQSNLSNSTSQNVNWSGQGIASFGSRNNRFGDAQSMTAVDAVHMVHLSLSEGLDNNWPFGTSILESVFKVYKQKELLEEAILIYRIQRAPERRVYYVDVGDMPAHKAGAYVERVKNEIHQRRFPTRNGGGMNVTDAAYNPMSMMEDMFFAQTASGRGSKVETLPGGENLGQIDDLKWFDNKLVGGLRVPSSYVPSGPDGTTQNYTDGRVGTAYIQEFMFAEYCSRLQNLLSPIFDEEFKLFVKSRGHNIDASLYELEFNEPENFGTYAKIELDSAQIGVYGPLSEMKQFSKRWLMINKLGMTEEEVMDNERMWMEENPEAVDGLGDGGSIGPGGGNGGLPGLEGVGVRPETDDLGDTGMGDDAPPPTGEEGAASPISGDEGAVEDDV